jgi:hypothetical protein
LGPIQRVVGKKIKLNWWKFCEQMGDQIIKLLNYSPYCTLPPTTIEIIQGIFITLFFFIVCPVFEESVGQTFNTGNVKDTNT